MLILTAEMNACALELEGLLKCHKYEDAAIMAKRMSSMGVSEVLLNSSVEDIIHFSRELSNTGQLPFLGRIFSHFPHEFILVLFDEFSINEQALYLNHLPSELIAELINFLPKEVISKGQSHLVDKAKKYKNYPEGSVGSIMSQDYLSADTESLVEDLIDAIKNITGEALHASYVFIINSKKDGKLEGVLSLRELISAHSKTKVSEVMHRDVLAAQVDEDALESAKRLHARNLKMLPVIDKKERLVGVIHISRAIDLYAQDLAEDLSAINAASPDENFFTPPREAIGKRLPWMASNIFLNLGAVAVISSFEETLVQVAILAAFLPMITDMGGNVGIQALSVSIRSIALGEARLIDFWKALRKEFFIGIFNGFALGGLFAVLAYFLQGSVVLGLVAGVALSLNVLIAGVVGGTIPFLIKRWGKDPAMMTGPILTTITDITGVSVYLGLCTIFLSSLL